MPPATQLSREFLLSRKPWPMRAPWQRASLAALEKAGIDEVVRVEDAEGVVVHGQKVPKGKAQHVALAAHRLRAAQNARAGSCGHVLGIVRAVVGDDPDVEQFARIVLRKQRAHGLADHARLVARGDHRGDALLRRGGGKPAVFAEKAQHDHAGEIDQIERAEYIQDEQQRVAHALSSLARFRPSIIAQRIATNARDGLKDDEKSAHGRAAHISDVFLRPRVPIFAPIFAPACIKAAKSADDKSIIR